MKRSYAMRSVLALIAAALVSGTGLADAPHKQPEAVPDAELLEFLGTVDAADSSADSNTHSNADSTGEADDGSWLEYLAQTDLDQAAKTVREVAPGPKRDAPKVKPDEQ